jgi:hypothetical protein
MEYAPFLFYTSFRSLLFIWGFDKKKIKKSLIIEKKTGMSRVFFSCFGGQLSSFQTPSQNHFFLMDFLLTFGGQAVFLKYFYGLRSVFLSDPQPHALEFVHGNEGAYIVTLEKALGGLGLKSGKTRDKMNQMAVPEGKFRGFVVDQKEMTGNTNFNSLQIFA